MWQHYFKTAFRSIKFNRTFSIINIMGLAVGLTAAITLLLWTNRESHFDDFHSKADRIFHLSASFNANGRQTTFKSVPAPLAVMGKKIAGIESMVRIHELQNQTLTDHEEQKIFDQNKIAFVDSTFLKIFDFKLLKGDGSRMLSETENIALTKQTALKLFGTLDVLGKSVRFKHHTFTVSAVLQNCPDNSTLQFDALVPMAFFSASFTRQGGNKQYRTIDEDISSYMYSTYVLLKEKIAPQTVEKQLSAAFQKVETSADIHFSLQNIQQMHLVSADGNTSALQMVHMMLLVGIVILIIGSINYINLSTARSLSKTKEVAVRKIIGAGKSNLFIQFITETFLIFTFALILSVILLWLSIPLIKSFTDTSIFSGMNNWHTWKLMGLAIIGTLMAASIYPAILVASLNPLRAFSGRNKPNGKTKSIKGGLVIFQFGMSFALLVTTLIMNKQMNYIQKKDVGYNKNYVFIVPFPSDQKENFDAIRTALNNNPAIQSAGFASAADVSDMNKNTGNIKWPGQPQNTLMMIGQLQVDEHFIPTMQYRFSEGGNFKGNLSDSNKFIVNETAVRDMGLRPPYVGQKITFQDKPGEIIGILNDFNFKPLNEKITPILLYSKWDNPTFLYVRAGANTLNRAVNQVKSIYAHYADKTPFNYNFLDQNMEAHYKQQYRTASLFKFFTCVAIFLSSLGLLGLISFSVQSRIKEIAVRKVLGANLIHLVRLMSKEFMILVLIGSCIFAPLSYWGLTKWLEEFAYKIQLGITPFMMAITIVLGIAFTSISYIVIAAARSNPVNNLKSE